jgi:hypothetical protein
MIMCYVVRSIATPHEAVIDEYGIIGKPYNSERNLLQCHFVHRESHLTL